jgi:hypothetical protein
MPWPFARSYASLSVPRTEQFRNPTSAFFFCRNGARRRQAMGTHRVPLSRRRVLLTHTSGLARSYWWHRSTSAWVHSLHPPAITPRACLGLLYARLPAPRRRAPPCPRATLSPTAAECHPLPHRRRAPPSSPPPPSASLSPRRRVLPCPRAAARLSVSAPPCPSH